MVAARMAAILAQGAHAVAPGARSGLRAFVMCRKSWSSSDQWGNTASMAALRACPPAAVPHVPPLWREIALRARAGRRCAAARSTAAHGVPDGDGRAVMLIPGFLAGDGSLATMTHWLRQHGYHTRRAGIRANVGCSEEACARLEARLEGFAEHTGQQVTIIGQSRGGVFARALAVRRPDLVAGHRHARLPDRLPAAHPPARARAGRPRVGARQRAASRACSAGSCLRGDCCDAFREALAGPFPEDVGYVAMYSRSDGIVDWHSCLDRAAELVEVGASHCGMAVSAQVYREIAFALGALRRRRRRRAGPQAA